MRYLSVCSGIEAASVAWHHLGWTPVAFSEIEPFPAAVLKHRYPHVPNYGDMTKFKEWPLEPGAIDLLVGGTPCQSFSVAGLRKGLSDPRGGLMLTYLEIAQRLRPRWIVWENVPGVLSSGGGRDLGAFLGALGELGYGWAYRVLDAQWVRTQRHPRAVPQRRRRLFVVGCLIERCAGNWERAAQVLFERESVQRDSAPRRAQGEGSAADAEGCAATVSSKWAKGTGGPAGDECYNLTTQPISGTIGNRGLRSHTELDGHGAYIPVQQPVPFTKAKRAQSMTDDETWVDGKVNPTISLFDQGDTRATTVAVAFKPGQSAQARTIGAQLEVACTLEAGGGGNNKQAVAIGTDCYNGAITGDVAATMGTPGSSVNASGPTVMAFDWQKGNDVNNSRPSTMNVAVEHSQTIGTTRTPAVAFSSNISVPDCQTDGTTPTMKCGGQGPTGNPPAVAHALRGEGFDASEDGTGRGTPLVPTAMTVRRLTPTECSRLQGFPDDWTLIPWRGKPADQCPDGPRYKALGNSMAVNCMAWIGERIAAVEARP